MYEHMTFEHILQRMLSRVPNDIDKREGSIIYDALAPAAFELAQMYMELNLIMDLSFVDTASGDYLTRLTAQVGVNRRPATRALRRGIFVGQNSAPIDVPIGNRFSIAGVAYTVLSREMFGQYVLECEQPGVIGNQYFGVMLPVDYVTGLVRAELTEVLVPGEDEEADEVLRQRYYEEVNNPPFGGNVAQYKQIVNAIDGVGATKVFPTWQGGGTAKCTIIAADWSVPSPQLLDEVQEIIDPTPQGKGLGQAPIGHEVTIAGVTEHTISIETTLSLASDMTPGQVQADVEEVIAAYLLELRQNWAQQQQLIVRTAQIDARILTVPGVEDVEGTEINGDAANLTLGEDEIPMMGSVVIHG
ncbi:phage tail protein [Xylanibacillus composti]|uniref:Phage tail protein n=1 Tax=Xylanibacillus composti TaxID=1572762 RepID=A0A8J4M3F4_9BACL|nr:baseplate J/gp47 family protein [Xylanibacillus composti]MDT9723757.1 phage tail protein [Xylanibacillus composti]GIQ70774.1 phage tail protein [Xylanibacillus composti]